MGLKGTGPCHYATEGCFSALSLLQKTMQPVILGAHEDSTSECFSAFGPWFLDGLGGVALDPLLGVPGVKLSADCCHSLQTSERSRMCLLFSSLLGWNTRQKQLRGGRLYLSSGFIVGMAVSYTSLGGSGSNRGRTHILADQEAGRGGGGGMNSGQRQSWTITLNLHPFRLMLAN